MNSSDDQSRAEEIFHAALDLEETEREDYLREACGEDAGLRAEVDSLLLHHEKLGSFLNDPAVGPDATLLLEEDAPAPEYAGRFRLLRRIGTGGMGEVWFAEQTEPLRRNVAIKIIKPGMDSKEIVARFEAERQAVALMDHPGVAKLFEAGAMPDGRPFFAMEYVEGLPITEYCDRHRLSTRERLDLIMRVCESVQHAHQKAILHRDLKPSNILVTEHDGRPLPKVIDFGVAKALAQPLTDHTMNTHLSTIIGTPEYMSPEQAAPDSMAVDTRSDVYSLGVVMYEMLVGELPLNPEELRRSGFEGIHRYIATKEPVRPSTLVGSGGVSATTMAEARRVDTSTLQRQLRGDLDWITMKALEKDPSRRYGSPSELAADIRRHLEDDPVLAGPPSRSYRLSKFVRRHRVGVYTAAIVLVGVLLGAAGLGAGLMRALRAERVAVDEAARANREAEAATQVSDFLVELFRVPDPNKSQGDTLTAREVLDRGVVQIRDELVDQPLVRARLLHSMGQAYFGLGRYPQAIELFEEARDERLNLLGATDPATISSQHQLALAIVKNGDPREALATLDAALEQQPNDREEVDYALVELRHVRAQVLLELGEHQEAKSELEWVIEQVELRKGSASEDLVSAWNNYGNLMVAMQDIEAAVDAFGRCREMLEELPGEHDDRIARLLINTGALEVRRGNLEEGGRIISQARPMVDRIYGKQHRESIGVWMNHAVVQFKLQNFDEARIGYYEVLGRAEISLGPDHPQVSSILTNMGIFHLAVDEPAEARELLSRALRIRRETFGYRHSSVSTTSYYLAKAQAALGENAEARALFLEVISIDKELYGENDGGVAEDYEAYAEFLESIGSEDEAAQARAEALRIRNAGAQAEPSE